jgi:protein NrfD
MDRYVADPHWGGLIVAYFFLGGVAAGSFAVAELAALLGDEADRRATRVAYYIAFPLVCACGALLVVDLGRPERFWHMMIQSETFRPMFKWWSPMSAGSWGLSAFGAFSFARFVQVLVEDGRINLGRLSPGVLAMGRGWPNMAISAGGMASAFFLGSYTGVLLTATNQPIWANTTWLGALFLASAASTGVAAMLLLVHRRPRDVDPHAVGRLEWVDGWAMGLEGLMLVAFALSLGGFAGEALGRWPGVLIPAFVVPAGLLLPMILRRSKASWAVTASSLLILLAGLVLRAAVVGMPAPLLLTRH